MINFNVRQEDAEYEAILLEMTDEVALVEVDGEVFEVNITLFNPFHDSLGRFASKHGSGIGKAAVSSAAIGAGIGGVVGAVRGVFTKDEMGRKLGLRRGALQGAVYGAKKGLIAGAVKETFNIAADQYAGKYGFAVKLLGGLSVAFAGAKGLTALGVTNTDIRGIGAGIASAGLFDLIMQFDEILLAENNSIAALAMYLAEALEEHPEAEYIGTSKEIDLTPLGFTETEDAYIISQEKAIDLLAALLTYGETKLEIEDNEVVQLFNPYHDKLGRFAAKGQLAAAGSIVPAIGVGLIGAWGSALTKATVTRKAIKKIQKERGNKRTPDKDTVAAESEKILDEKIISTKVGNKEVSVSYRQLDRGFSKVSSIGFKSSAAAAILLFALPAATQIVGGSVREGFEDEFAKQRNYYSDSYSNSGTSRSRQWPQRATEDDFKRMHRKLAKKWHPDVNKNSQESTDKMKKINELYEQRDWYGIEDLYKKLYHIVFGTISLAEESNPTEMFEFMGLFLRTLQEAKNDDSDYVTFPHSGEKEEDFVYEDGEMILDRASIEVILDTFVPKTDKKLEVDYSKYITEL